MIALALTLLCGAVLLTAALLKALNPRPFFQHLDSVLPFSPSLSAFLGFLFVEFEAGLGLALMLHLYPEELVPLTIVVLILFSFYHFFALTTQKETDCGCYGGLVRFGPKTSLFLNLLLLALLVFAFLFPAEYSFYHPLMIWSVILTSFFCGFIIKRSLKKPWFDFSRLKVGKRFQTSWLLGEVGTESVENAHLFLFGSGCVDCRKWAVTLAEVDTVAHKLMVVLPKNVESERIFGAKASVDLKILTMEPGVFRSMVFQTPCCVELDQGVVVKKWDQSFPEFLLD